MINGGVYFIIILLCRIEDDEEEACQHFIFGQVLVLNACECQNCGKKVLTIELLNNYNLIKKKRCQAILIKINHWHHFFLLKKLY